MAKTLIFTITTGRSGTVFLTELMKRNLPDARVYHEHQQWWAHGVDTPDHSDLMHFNNAGVTPKIRAFWRRKFERVLAEPGSYYFEASHYLAKAGVIENLDLLPEDVSVQILWFKRDVYKTARSLFNLGEFQNPASSWVWLPPGARNVLLQQGPFQRFGRAGMVLWYVLEMRARGAYYQELLRERPGVTFLETGPEALRDEQAVRAFLEQVLGATPEQVEIPPPRNDGQSRTVTTEHERAQLDQVYQRVQGDAEGKGRELFEQGRRLGHVVSAPSDPQGVLEPRSEAVPSSREAIRTIVVLGAWSSGTTALVGYLSRLGAYTCPPHVSTNDPRTPNSLEPRELQQTLKSFVDQHKLQWARQDLEAFRQWLVPWLAEQKEAAAQSGCSHVVLKHPLTAFFIRDLYDACQPTFIVMSRPFEAIEASRQRRGWHPVYGQAGAKVIYQRIFTTLIEQQLEALQMSFDRFRADPSLGGRLHAWTDLNPEPEMWSQARKWVL
ncbi:MAG: hypothetical protein ACLFSI_05335 [Halorhodospira sp.]